MATIIIYNRGKNTFTGIPVPEGGTQDFSPGEALEVEEVVGLRLCNSYPKLITSAKPTDSATAESLRRKEQSLNDREVAINDRQSKLDAREKELDTREKAIAEKENKAKKAK